MDSETVSRWSGSIFHIVILSVTKFLSVLSTNSPRAQMLVYSQSSTGTNQTADQQKFGHIHLEGTVHESMTPGLFWFHNISWLICKSIDFVEQNVPFQHERTGMTKLHQCPCSPFQGRPRLQNTRRLCVGETWHFCNHVFCHVKGTPFISHKQ
jgi:hypothetical protein